jgi:phosphohistidine phosphatase
MRIVLFRHGLADQLDPERWPDDMLRPLSSRGIPRTRRAARGVARLEPGIRQVFTSPAARASDTARLLVTALGRAGEPVELPSLTPDGAWRATLKRLAEEAADTTVALVGHEPGLSALAAALLLSAEARALGFKKAGACSIDCDAPAAGRGHLRWWLGPGALRAIRSFKKGRVS